MLGGPYVGFILVIFSPELDLMNSLLMNSPVGRVIFLPLGALRSIERSDILEAAELKVRWFESVTKDLLGIADWTNVQ